MSGKRSRNKGANGEREFARLVQSYGFDCERTGRNGRTAEDVTHSVPGYHFEVKRQETLCLPAWLRQAHADANEPDVPAVGFRRNRTSPTDPLGQWHAIQPCEDLFRLLAEVRDLRAKVEQLQRLADQAQDILDVLASGSEPWAPTGYGYEHMGDYTRDVRPLCEGLVGLVADRRSPPDESGD